MRLTQEAVKELKSLEDRRGRLTPQAVLEAAEDESSALHICFEWDDSKAAYEHRVDQARQLLKRVKIEVTVEDRTFRVVGYVRDPNKAADKPGYMNTLKVRCQTAIDMMRNEIGCVCADLSRVVKLAEARADELPDGCAGKVASIKARCERICDDL